MKDSGKYIVLVIKSILVLVLIQLLLKSYPGKDFYDIMMLIPFIGFFVFYLARSYFSIFQKHTLAMICFRLSKICVLCFWFGMLIYVDMQAVMENEYDTVVFSLLFWGLGIIGLQRVLQRKK